MLGTSHDARATGAPTDAVDPEATFERTLERSWPSLVRFLRATAGADQDVEELAAQVIELAWRRREKLVDQSGMTPWLLAIAHNVVRNGQRSSNRRLRLRRRLEDAHDGRAHPSAHAELMRGESGPATRALGALSPADREVLVLHAWEDLDIAGLAQVLGISRSAASQRLHRARTRLAAALESMEDDR